ncbi:chromate efflux transporter [Rhizobium sp. CB3090]|uniref:chromate efflux transporter n=1 Tax=Rhizobium sp. CB3090 TaxID=3039156 RepID=UPI0024B19A5E|nr:chromate efflux transporter [Rhizobium sp. CB3090]WFU09561.1 chromate efflux transporter [Rhizobium sp. CB3090]
MGDAVVNAKEVAEDRPAVPPAGTPREVFGAFLKLGLTSFGGPIAHLGYFRDELVARRKWIDEKGYADLIALCQFLPGPASSQVGFAMGLLRAGPLGALAAWSAFTLPSALILLIFATAATALDNTLGQALLHGLKLVAVAVVAQAVWGMAKSLTPDRPRAGIALAAIFMVTFGGALGQLAAIVLGAVAGLALCRGVVVEHKPSFSFGISRSAGLICLLVFLLLLFGLPLLVSALDSQGLRLFDAFYRSGALVFGGGHVVLPLLQAEVVRPGWVSENAFLAGYGVAQAVPGPLFTFSAYLGAAMIPSPHGLAGAAISLLAIFLPGFLLLVGTLPFWDRLSTYPLAQAAMRGANAAVVGVLAAALYNPVWTSAVLTSADFALALSGFLLLVVWKSPPWIVVVLMAASAVISQMA